MATHKVEDMAWAKEMHLTLEYFVESNNSLANTLIHIIIQYDTQPTPLPSAPLDSLNSLSLARACSTLEAPMRLDRDAERVAANTPRVIRGANTLIYCVCGGGCGGWHGEFCHIILCTKSWTIFGQKIATCFPYNYTHIAIIIDIATLSLGGSWSCVASSPLAQWRP